MREEVHRALIEDGTGVPDYALESVGGSVVTTRCTETYTQYASVVSIMGIPLWYQTPSPRTVIQVLHLRNLSVILSTTSSLPFFSFSNLKSFHLMS